MPSPFLASDPSNRDHFQRLFKFLGSTKEMGNSLKYSIFGPASLVCCFLFRHFALPVAVTDVETKTENKSVSNCSLWDRS